MVGHWVIYIAHITILRQRQRLRLAETTNPRISVLPRQSIEALIPARGFLFPLFTFGLVCFLLLPVFLCLYIGLRLAPYKRMRCQGGSFSPTLCVLGEGRGSGVGALVIINGCIEHKVI
jgi:hypothetical protein